MLDTIDSVEPGQLTDDDNIDDVILSIEHAAATYESINRMVFAIEAAKATGNLETQQQSLQIAQLSIRNHYRNFFQGEYEGYYKDRQISVEGIHDPSWVVMALEEESENGKNILERIIDAITNAFKWLWEKISSLFSSGDSEKTAEDKGLKTYSELEKQIKSTPNFPSGAVLKGGEINRFLSHVGADVKLDDIGAPLEEQGKQAEELVKLILALSTSLRDAAGVAEKVKSTPTAEVLSKEKTEFEAGVKKAVTENVKTAYSENDHGKYGAVKEVNTIIPADSRVLGPILTNSGPVITVIAAMTEGGYKGMLGKAAKGNNANAKISLPGALSELLPFQEKVNKYLVAVGRMNDDLHNKANSLSSDGKRVAESLSSLKSSLGKGDDAVKVIKGFCDLAKNIGQLQGAMVTTVGNFRTSANFVNSIVPAALAVVRGEAEKSDKKAEKKADEKKE